MPNLQPYANPNYFLILGAALIPLVIGLLNGKRWHVYETLVSLLFLILIFDGDKVHQGIALIGYVLFEGALIWGYTVYRQKHNNTWLFDLAVILAIMPLVIVKFVSFLNSGSNSILGFLGISYLTFKSVGMIMETRDGSIKKFEPWLFLQFMLFFPTISSGPIDRYRRFKKDYLKVPDRDHYLDLLGKAVHNFMLGFVYKFMLGYLFGTVLLPKVAHLAMASRGGFLDISWGLVGYMYVYSMYLFFDFAGYSLFAVATSYVMGVETPINFNKPFASPNIKEFWNRWHMTLSFWFRDYIYMRLVFFLMKHKITKNKVLIANLGYLTLFLLMGFWHGLTWYYIVYGLFHAIWIILTDVWLRFKKKHKDHIISNRWTNYLAIFATFNTVCLSFLIFSGFLDRLWFH
ncbi:D-alanyl-lipoteichoic acid biosynthesis protein DltB [Latilactobacillus curvatus]|uniref:D-alanyl-lipoteichoic acid biosynthesis protein DltB n=1 Tax=Latilactobacillus curvatus TaxID=28038 RepID=UPI000977E63C|nr:D-alanyl-lipoteichoic acid biosynthesis protein DltB [Latilactobacillus curvatus]SMH69779.1 putative D-alanine esterase for lipoteichoic acid and wall teichoic acid [Latilactobacillus curvatus]